MMGVDVEGSPRGNVDDKRFYLPGVKIAGQCPRCTRRVEMDFGGDCYLVHPPMNKPFTRTIYCGECHHEWPVTLELRVSLEIRQ